MGQFDLNLSTRPFKPYRAANLGLFLLLLVLIGVSVIQFYSYQKYSTLAAASREEEGTKRAEANSLKEQMQSLDAKMAKNDASKKLTEVELLNQLLVSKSFSWTRLLANLENIMPDNVRLVSLRPFVDQQGRRGMNMIVRGKTFGDATQFLQELENSKFFSSVALAVEEKKSTAGEVEFTLSAFYGDGGAK